MTIQRNLFGICVRNFAMGIGLCLAVQHSALADIRFSSGHGDIGVGYSGPGALELHWHMEEGAVVGGNNIPAGGSEFEPSEVFAWVPTSSSFLRDASSSWNFIGNAAGETTFFLPETDTPGVIFLGFGSEELTAGDWFSTNLSWNISSFSGPGHFSMYNLDGLGNPVVAASTFNSALEFTTVLGDHGHFNLAFTQAGIYDIQFTVTGIHDIDGLATDTATFRFDVSAVPEPTSIAMISLVAGLVSVQRLRRKSKSRTEQAPSVS